MEKEVGKSIMVIILLLLAGASIFLAYFLGHTKYTECESDSDCVKIQTSCCPCESSGEEQCIAKNYIPKEKDCNKNLFCSQLYNCNIEKCVCEKGKCIAKIKQ